MVGRRYFSGNPKVGQSGKSRQVATLHPGTPPAKREGCPLLMIIIIMIMMIMIIIIIITIIITIMIIITSPRDTTC